MSISPSVRGLNRSGLKQRNGCRIMPPGTQPISECGASMPLRLYGWVKKHLAAGSKRIRLEDVRKLLGLKSVKDAAGNVIREAPLPIWTNFQQRALEVGVAEVNTKTDLKIKLASIQRSKHRRVAALNFTIKTQPIPKG
jgi:hypothetical protein